ncbi:type IV secretion system protein VirB6 [Alcaligenes faecalis subsp. faecalis NCIB 8687]|nr:type IV secretion system protein VirB6 [Alcaligenes faecalis subsp. faecalis NCIB 8687]
MPAGFASTQVAAPQDPESIAQWITAQTEAVLQSAVAQPIAELTSTLMPVITLGLTLQFMAYAFAIMHGQGNMTVTEFFKKAVGVAIIAMIATAGGLYQTDIAQTMLGLPDALTSVVIGDTTVAAQVDKLQQETSVATQAMGNAGDSGWFDFVPDARQIIITLLTFAVTVSSALVGGIIAVITIVVKVGIALIVASGPVFIAFLLFEPTRKMFDSWVAQALNFVFLALLAGLIFAVLLQLNLQFVRAMAQWLDGGDVNLMALFAGQLLVAIASIVIMTMLPGMAAGLSSGFGAQFGIGAAGRGAYTALRLRSLIKPRLPGAGPKPPGTP